MTENPILKVLSTFKKHKVKSLLIGGQACIIYGAAEFSRDSDFMVLCDHKNLEHLRSALAALKAEPIYFPPLDADYLERGHACHFRCQAKDVKDLRIDVISKLRGCDPFDKLWERKNTIALKSAYSIDVIGLKDLVKSKKTQRDKDWLMLKRLVENDYFKNRSSRANLQWWLLEGRSADFLIDLAKNYPILIKKCAIKRPLLSWAIAENTQQLNTELLKEESLERQKDIDYWAPLKRELEMLRHRFRGHV